MVERIGAVTKRRYVKLVDEAVAAVETISGCQFRLGEIALEIEPMNAVGVGTGGDV